MRLAFAFASLMLTDEINAKINEQLNTIINGCDLTQMEIGIQYDKEGVHEFEDSQIEDTKRIWEDITKLSINLFVDYQHHSQFLFKSRYNQKEYRSRLFDLGFVFENDLWKSVRKPDLKDVQTNMFMYFLCRVISDKMALSADNELNEKNERQLLKLDITVDRCTFCDGNILDGEDCCGGCGSTNEEMRTYLSLKSQSDVIGTAEEINCSDKSDKNENVETIIEMKKSESNQMEKQKRNDEVLGNISDKKVAMKTEKSGFSDKRENNENCVTINEEKESERNSATKKANEKFVGNISDKKVTKKTDISGFNDMREKNENCVTINEGGKLTRNRATKKKREEIVGNISDKNADRIKKWECGKCGFLNEYTLSNCEVCGELLKDGSWVCGQCKAKNGYDKNECYTCKYRNDNIKIDETDKISKGRIGNEVHLAYGDVPDFREKYVEGFRGQVELPIKINTIEERGLLDEIKDHGEGTDRIKKGDYIGKWECGACGLLNEYKAKKCAVCASLFEDGRWTCGACRWENSCKNHMCYQCNTRNVNVNEYNSGYEGFGKDFKNYGVIPYNFVAKKSRYPLLNGDQSHVIVATRDIENDKVISEDKWRCGKCQIGQSYNNIDCEECGCSRLNMGLWQCHKCTMVNKCVTERCVTCGSWSKYLPEKYCMDCRQNRVVGTELHCDFCANDMNITWKCRYKRCGIMNEGSEQYCAKCKLWRYNPTERGAECKQYASVGFSPLIDIKRVWVCHKCDGINNVAAPRCSKGLCGMSRYPMMTCANCHVYTNGSSNHCQNCLRPLLFNTSVT